ncbi:MAG TPA: hypothetical protein DCM48_04230 [Thalassospira sp.]|nr:hypothetical protein [Thalassospira sp.]|tara:strand:+ start:89 stop:277 length:189 start_codon:yes stop_codon:yes gene_type:complete
MVGNTESVLHDMLMIADGDTAKSVTAGAVHLRAVATPAALGNAKTRIKPEVMMLGRSGLCGA